MGYAFRIVRYADMEFRDAASSQNEARQLALHYATKEGNSMLILPDCQLIGETYVRPLDPRINPGTGEWIKEDKDMIPADQATSADQF
jgi:hypothetical protein